MTKEKAPQSEALSDTLRITEDMRSQRGNLITIPFSEHIQKIYAVSVRLSNGKAFRTYSFYELAEAIECLQSCPTPRTCRLEVFFILRNRELDPHECELRGIPRSRREAEIRFDLKRSPVEEPVASASAIESESESESEPYALIWCVKRFGKGDHIDKSYSFNSSEEALDYADWCLEKEAPFYLETYHLIPNHDFEKVDLQSFEANEERATA